MKRIISFILVFVMSTSLVSLLPERVSATEREEVEQNVLDIPEIGNVMVAAGNKHTVKLMSNGRVIAVGKNDYGQCNVEDWTDIVQVSASYDYTVGLNKNGTVVAVGKNDYGQCNVEDWTDIVQVSAGYDYTIGLKKDGTVVAVGNSVFLQDIIDNWTDIIQVDASNLYSTTVVGLKKDGTVVASQNFFGECDVEDWTDIVQVSTNDRCTVGLKKDGTIVIAGYHQSKSYPESWTDIVQVQVSANAGIIGLKSDGTVVGYETDWTDIVQFSVGNGYIIGLKNDGSVVAFGDNEFGQCTIENWENITQISSSKHTVGLKRDGTVIAFGHNSYGECNTESWTDIIQIDTFDDATVGIRKDGTVVATGYNENGRLNVEEWKDIIQVSVGNNYTLGLKKDGTVVIAGDNRYRENKFSAISWKGIIQIAAGYNFTIGLKKNGTVVGDGPNYHWYEEKLRNWKDIIQVCKSDANLLGLKKDGTIESIYASYGSIYGQYNVNDWKDIIQVSSNYQSHVLGLKKDGTVVATGNKINFGQYDVEDWRDIIQVSAGHLYSVGLKKDGTILNTKCKLYPSLNSDVEGYMPDFNIKGFINEIALDGEIVISVLPKNGLMFVAPPIVESKEKNVEVAYFEEDGIDKYYLKGAKLGKDTISVTATTIPKDSSISKNSISTFARANTSAKANTTTREKNINVGDGIPIKGSIYYIDNNGKETELKKAQIKLYKDSINNFLASGYIGDNGQFEIRVAKEKLQTGGKDWYLIAEIIAQSPSEEVRVKIKKNNEFPVYSVIPKEKKKMNGGIDRYDNIKFTIDVDAAAPFFIFDTVNKGRNAWPGELKNLNVYYNTGGKVESDIELSLVNMDMAWFQESSDGRAIVHYPYKYRWSEPVILHEVGHSVFNSVNGGKIGGEHEIFNHYKNSLAYSEGWANFYAHMVLNEKDLNFVDYTIKISDKDSTLIHKNEGKEKIYDAKSLYPRYLDRKGIANNGDFQIVGINYKL